MLSDHKRVLIVSGGRLGAWAIAQIKRNDYLIGADVGALFLIKNGFRPHLSIGDFDSVTAEEKRTIEQHSHTFLAFDAIQKDESDTELAFLHATQMKPKPSEIILLGVLGTRFDHSLANIHLLHKANSMNMLCSIIDEYNIIRVTDHSLEITPVEGFTHISLLPLTLEVTGVTLTGFEYPLHEASLSLGNSLSISNKLSDTTAQVSIRSGQLLIIQSRDG